MEDAVSRALDFAVCREADDWEEVENRVWIEGIRSPPSWGGGEERSNEGRRLR